MSDVCSRAARPPLRSSVRTAAVSGVAGRAMDGVARAFAGSRRNPRSRARAHKPSFAAHPKLRPAPSCHGRRCSHAPCLPRPPSPSPPRFRLGLDVTAHPSPRPVAAGRPPPRAPPRHARIGDCAAPRERRWSRGRRRAAVPLPRLRPHTHCAAPRPLRSRRARAPPRSVHALSRGREPASVGARMPNHRNPDFERALIGVLNETLKWGQWLRVRSSAARRNAAGAARSGAA